VNRCMSVVWNSVLNRRSSSCRLCFISSFSSAKRCPRSAPCSRPKNGSIWVLNQIVGRMTIWSIFLLSRNIRIRCFNFFHDWTYRPELILSPLYKDSTIKIPSLSQKILAMTLPA
jgi:hypothetical protein